MPLHFREQTNSGDWIGYRYLHTLWYIYLHLVFLIMTGFHEPIKTSLSMHQRFIITLVMQITLSAMFAITGCGRVSYFCRKSKKARLERVSKQEVIAVELLSDLGEHNHLSEMSEEKLKRFVQIFLYGIYVLIYVLIFYIWLTENMG